MKTLNRIFLLVLSLTVFSGEASATPKEINQLSDGRVLRSDDGIPTDRDLSAIVTQSTAQSGGSSTITLAAGASAVDDAYNNMQITIVSGTGIGQYKTISDYVGSTKVATVSSAWRTQPDSTSVYQIRSVNQSTHRGFISDQLYADIKAYGAICDGNTHPLSSSSKDNPDVGYSTLSAAQEDYPLATALTQEIDQIVIEDFMNRNGAFYIPEGSCMMNYASTLSSKTWYVKSHPRGILKNSSGSPLIEQLFTCTSCTIYAEGLNMDGENKVLTHFYLSNPSAHTFIDYEGYDIGWTSVQATNMVVSIWMNGNMSGDYVFDNVKFSDVYSISNGNGADNIGSARLSPWIVPSTTQKPKILIRDMVSDATGSDAEELDLFNQSVNLVYGSWLTIENPSGCYNGNTRRLIKVHSGDGAIYNPHYFKCSDFVTAPTAIGNTSVGAKNNTAIDNAGAGQGSITIYGGSIDVSGFATGFAGSSSCTDCYIKANGTEFVGGVYQIDRHDPEYSISGTSVAGTTTTITLSSSYSSATSSYYNGSNISVSGGSCTTETRTISAYNGTTRVATVSVAFTTTPDSSCTYSIYKPQTGSAIVFATGSSDRGSGCDNCYFKDGYVGAQLRGYQSYIRNSFFDDPVSYPIWINPASSARTGITVENNTVVTKTTSRLKNDTAGTSIFRIIPVQVATDYKIVGNRLIQDGNTDHQGAFIDELTSGVGGVVAFNQAPATYTGGTMLTHQRLLAIIFSLKLL
jgi:hypothetical protein